MRAKHSLSLVVLLVLLLAAFGCTQLGMRSDAQIAGDVQGKINADQGLPNKQITIQSANGVVTLSGTVASEMERTTAANDASQVRGVKTVVNNLQVGTVTAGADMGAAGAPPMAPAAPAPRAAAPASRPRLAHRSTAAAPPERARDYGASSSSGSSASGSSGSLASSSAPPMPTLAPSAPAAPVSVTVPEGTTLSIRLIDEVNTERNKAGDPFKATLDSPVVVGDKVAIPADADIEGRVVQAQNQGHYAGTSQLALELVRITYNGHSYDIRTEQFSKQGSSRGKRTAATVGGGAALGAIIGGIAGGGKGAAIGAAAGAGAGTGAEAITKPTPIKLPAETLLSFRLDSPVTVTPANNARRTRGE